MIGQHWAPSNKADPRAVAIYERHYSCRQYADGRKRTQCAPPGETIVLLTPTCDALFIWVKNKVERYRRLPRETVCERVASAAVALAVVVLAHGTGGYWQ